jgi:hypothetical protein
VRPWGIHASMGYPCVYEVATRVLGSPHIHRIIFNRRGSKLVVSYNAARYVSARASRPDRRARRPARLWPYHFGGADKPARISGAPRSLRSFFGVVGHNLVHYQLTGAGQLNKEVVIAAPVGGSVMVRLRPEHTRLIT